MKETEFRGLRKDGEGWAYGSLICMNGMKRYSIMHDGCVMFSREVSPKTIGQFIRKQDKHKKRAYEGDIVETVERDVAFEIKWNQDKVAFMFYDPMKKMWFEISRLDEMEITGNIYESGETE